MDAVTAQASGEDWGLAAPVSPEYPRFRLVVTPSINASAVTHAEPKHVRPESEECTRAQDMNMTTLMLQTTQCKYSESTTVMRDPGNLD